MSERFKIYIAAYLVLEKDDQILFHKRKNSGYMDGYYSLVAGHLDGAETAKQAIIREGNEETGIVLRQDDLQVAHVSHRFNPHREYIDIYLTASKWEGEITNMEPHKCDGLDWFPKDDLPENIVPEVKAVLEQISQNNFYSDIGFNQ